MKTEDGNDALHPWIEPELEARLTALVHGEASDFERAELEELMSSRPELPESASTFPALLAEIVGSRADP